jgi:hypothetical protein
MKERDDDEEDAEREQQDVFNLLHAILVNHNHNSLVHSFVHRTTSIRVMTMVAVNCYYGLNYEYHQQYDRRLCGLEGPSLKHSCLAFIILSPRKMSSGERCEMHMRSTEA